MNKQPRIRKKEDFSKFFSLQYQFQFLSITTFVATIFVIIGLVATQPKNKSSLELSGQSSVSLPKKSSLPLPSPQSSSSSISSRGSVLPLTEPRPVSAYAIKGERQPTQELAYKFTPSTLQKSQKLQTVVDEVVNLARSKYFPIESLSVSLINVNSGETAEYQEEKLRYPASVIKLFWLVAIYSYFETGIIQNPTQFSTELYKMLKKSDNEAASRLLDLITNTKSGSKLSSQEYQTWLNKRYSINKFFQKAGYKGINISQKTFPIPSEDMYEPKGRDLQMRGASKTPIRNKISTQQVARLMYEIFTGRAISTEYSQNLQQWLTWDLSSSYWKNLDPRTGSFNPIRTFFGESLPNNIYFASKAGWTSSTRQEVAYISDGRSAYILAVFGEDRAYAQNQKIFPQISRLVFERMTNYN